MNICSLLENSKVSIFFFLFLMLYISAKITNVKTTIRCEQFALSETRHRLSSDLTSQTLVAFNNCVYRTLTIFSYDSLLQPDLLKPDYKSISIGHFPPYVEIVHTIHNKLSISIYSNINSVRNPNLILLSHLQKIKYEISRILLKISFLRDLHI